MTNRWSVLFSVLVLIYSSVCLGDPRADFDVAYAQYQANTENGEWEIALESAELAYNLGENIFGKQNVNTGNLAFNYGRLLNRFGQVEEAKPVLLSARKILQTYYGKKNAALVDVNLELGKASYDEIRPQRGMRYFRHAVKLSADESTMVRAELNMRIAVFITANRGYARPFFETAYEGYLAELGTADARTALAAFNLGKYALSKRDYEEARNLLVSSIEVFESQASPTNRHIELTARAFLIEALEELGESDIATQHCRVIGSKTPQKHDASYLPVYKKPPVYPFAALRDGRSGWVIVEFTVDDNGFTRDHQIVKSTSGIFNAASITAAKKFRYAPRYEEGIAVTTEGVQNRLIYEFVN